MLSTEDRISASKTTGYALTVPPPGVSTARAVGYAVLAPPPVVVTGVPQEHIRGIAMQGDPRLIMSPDGTSLQFVGGQPLMDKGLENLVLISLFTNEGWCGNAFMKAPIGSGFEAACDQPVTRQSLNEIRAAAERALIDPALGRVTVTVTNPTGYRVKVHILILPPASNPQELTLTKNGQNWDSQANEAAYHRVRSSRWRQALLYETAAPLSFEGGAPMEF